MRKKLPWWMRDAPMEEKSLYFSGCPRNLWRIEYDDLPAPTAILHGSGTGAVRITTKEQRDWIQRISEELRYPHTVLIASHPTDLPGLALMTWWAKQDNLTLVDIGSIPDVDSMPETALGLYNMTVDASPQRVEEARDLLYRYKDRFVALVVSGVTEPVIYAREVLRFFRFSAIFHVEGEVGVSAKPKPVAKPKTKAKSRAKANPKVTKVTKVAPQAEQAPKGTKN